MTGGDVRLELSQKRSLLFLPASNSRAIHHARNSAADLVVLDLEDAVAPDDKERARSAAAKAVGEGFPMPVAIRVNAASTPWHAMDLDAVKAAVPDLVIVPRAESADDLASVRDRTGKPVAAMIETPRGLVAVHAIAVAADALIAGTNDLASGLRLPSGAGRGPLQMALQTIVLAARAAGIAVFDGVFNGLDDDDGFAAEAADSRGLGFDGKSLIHPRQIAPCHAAFAPGAEDVARAERLIASASGGAERFEGQMIERMHVEAAQRLLARR